MRLASILALAAVVSSPVLAQTQYADSSGGYVALNQLAFNGSIPVSLDGTVGYRLGRGIDVGIRIGYGRSYLSRMISVGPVAGVSRPLGRGFTGRVEGTARFISQTTTLPLSDTGEGSPQYGGYYAFQTLGQDVTATVSHPVRLLGSVRLRPTVGVYAAAQQIVGLSKPATSPYRANRVTGSAGLHVEIPLTFRLFGQDAAFTPAGRLAFAGDRFWGSTAFGGGYAGAGLRLNF